MCWTCSRFSSSRRESGRCARPPAIALELFENDRPWIAVIDLNLSPFDGFELIVELRRQTASLPIIVLTARGSEEDNVRALDTGADDYIVKPFGDRELIARARIFGGARVIVSRRALRRSSRSDRCG